MTTLDRRWHLDDLPDGTRLCSWNGRRYWWENSVLVDSDGEDADWNLVLSADVEDGADAERSKAS